MFLNPRILEDKLSFIMIKYGIRGMDSDIMFMINDAIKEKYSNIITELVTISRSAKSDSYLVNKNSHPMEVTEVHASNVINLDKAAGVVKPVPIGFPQV